MAARVAAAAEIASACSCAWLAFGRPAAGTLFGAEYGSEVLSS